MFDSSIKKIYFLLLLLAVSGCASTASQKRVLELPYKESDMAWSRAHSYLAQFVGDSFYLITDYAIAAEDSENIKTMMILKENYDDKTKIIIIAEKTDTGDEYYINKELKQDVENAKYYIQKGEIIEFKDDKEKKKPEKENGRGRGGPGGDFKEGGRGDDRSGMSGGMGGTGGGF